MQDNTIFGFIEYESGKLLDLWREKCKPYENEIDSIKNSEKINIQDVIRMYDIRDSIDDDVCSEFGIFAHSHIRVSDNGKEINDIDIEPPDYEDILMKKYNYGC